MNGGDQIRGQMQTDDVRHLILSSPYERRGFGGRSDTSFGLTSQLSVGNDIPLSPSPGKKLGQKLGGSKVWPSWYLGGRGLWFNRELDLQTGQFLCRDVQRSWEVKNPEEDSSWTGPRRDR